MNLLVFWYLPEGSLFPFNASDRYEARIFRGIDSRRHERVIPFQLMKPRSGNGRFPLLVFLHGAGERGEDNQRQLKYLPEQMAHSKMRKQLPCFLLAPQCGTNSAWSLEDQQAAVIALIEETVREQPAIDPTRIFLTGLSMGGSGTWRIATRRPDLFAAVVPICGAGDPQQASLLVGLPIWAIHGDADGVIPVQHSRDMIEAIRARGGQPLYTELKGVGHDSWTAAYQESSGMIEWMFSQTRVTAPVGTPSVSW